MLKIIIIDDEPAIRQGLRCIINWNSIGCEICAEAEDGKKGLEKVLELKPDIAIVDVKMPDMSGLEMIEELKKRQSNCLFIILTAFSDFKLAQKAIDLGVDSYVLKPIDEDELIDRVVKLKDQIIKNKLDKKHINSALSISKGKILQSLSLGELSENMIKEQNITYGFRFPWKSYQIAVIECVDVEVNIKETVENFMDSSNMGIAFDINGYCAVMFKDVTLGKCNKILMELQKLITQKLGVHINIYLGITVASIEKIPESCKHALNMMAKKFLYGHKGIIFNSSEGSIDTSGDKAEDAHFSSDDFIDNLSNAIEANNEDFINNIAEQVMKYHMLRAEEENIIKSSYAHILMMVITRLTKDNEKLKDMFDLKSVINEIYRKESFQDLHGYFKYNILMISQKLDSQLSHNPIERIMNYISRHYDKDIKLESLAELFNYNSAYLGKLFKSTAGIQFNAYLDSVRVSKAKELLESGMKVYQVAEKTGYKDIDYFYKKFKKNTGVCPTNYKFKATGKLQNH